MFIDRIEPHRDGLLPRDLERVMGEVVGMEILVKKTISRAPRVRMQRSESLLLDRGVAAHRARVADERSHFPVLHPRRHHRHRCRRERRRNRHRLSQPVRYDHVRHVAAARTLPYDAGGQYETYGHRTRRRYLPVALAEHQVSVTLVPLPPAFGIRIRHRHDRSSTRRPPARSIRPHVVLLVCAPPGAPAVSVWPRLWPLRP